MIEPKIAYLSTLGLAGQHACNGPYKIDKKTWNDPQDILMMKENLLGRIFKINHGGKQFQLVQKVTVETNIATFFYFFLTVILGDVSRRALSKESNSSNVRVSVRVCVHRLVSKLMDRSRQMMS